MPIGIGQALGALGKSVPSGAVYTPTQIVEMLQCADLRFIGAYKGLSKAPYKAEGQEAGGMLAVIAMRDE